MLQLNTDKQTKIKWRWMKYVVAYTLMMDTAITAVVLFVALKTMYIDSSSVAVVAALWSIEGVLTGVLKMFENKMKSKSDGDYPPI